MTSRPTINKTAKSTTTASLPGARDSCQRDYLGITHGRVLKSGYAGSAGEPGPVGMVGWPIHEGGGQGVPGATARSWVKDEHWEGLLLVPGSWRCLRPPLAVCLCVCNSLFLSLSLSLSLSLCLSPFYSKIKSCAHLL